MTDKQEYTYEYRNKKGYELFTDKILSGPVSEKEAYDYAKKSLIEETADNNSECVMIVIFDEQLEEVNRVTLEDITDKIVTGPVQTAVVLSVSF